MSSTFNCVTPEGKFIFGIHKPSYSVSNLRLKTKIEPLGILDNCEIVDNRINYPHDDIQVNSANWIYEIPNPFPFRGRTYIDKSWADTSAQDYSKMLLPKPDPLSFKKLLNTHNIDNTFFSALPRPLLLTLATCSTDPEDLEKLAELSCKFIKNEKGQVTGLQYLKNTDNRVKADISDYDLFEAVANNPALPDEYKIAMVLRPGAQGGSEIIGEWLVDEESHVFEYLRRNSYIAGGHFAANMADDAIRYSIHSLKQTDMDGLRHLYYQRMYIRLSEVLGIDLSDLKVKKWEICSPEKLEQIRLHILHHTDQKDCRSFATLWGWNFGFDFSPTTYRLHASHQQIHQQYAVIPDMVETYSGDSSEPIGSQPSFSCGDMVTRVIEEYAKEHNSDFFTDYYSAIRSNVRMDNREDLPSSLIVWQDENVMVFIPKAQTSQWEVQIMTKPDPQGKFPGNLMETDIKCRKSLNKAILKTQKIFEKIGAKMVTSIEYSKRLFTKDPINQPLLYSLLPKLPFSPGAFSEAQLRFINGHYPEDFAALCKKHDK